MSPQEIIGLISIILMVVMALCHAFQVVYLFVPFFVKPKPHKEEKLHRYAILIAARNEQNVLPHLLDSIAAQDYPQELITTYVIADNCTDSTAQVAAAGGARVYQRFNDQQVGKGYALNYLISKIREEGCYEDYDAFMIFDADNLLSRDFMTQINKTFSDGYDGATSYRNSKNLGTNWVSALMSMWYLHDSSHLNLSRQLLGVPCHVTGTGFGFTRQLLDKMGGNWNFFTLTEDIEFSAWCATHGARVGYNYDAVLYDEQPVRFLQSWRQRTRWTQGGVQVSFRLFKNYFTGILQGGTAGYGSFEAMMLSLWGYVLGGLSGIFGMINSYMLFGWTGIAVSAAAFLPMAYFSAFFMGALVLITEWKRMRATPGQKVKAMFVFPLFLITYIPIAATALVRKFHWPPIEHTVAVGMDSLQDE